MGLLILVAVLAGSAPQTAPAAPASPPARAAARKSGLICVEDTPLGSRLGARRICRTAAEWERDRREVRDDTERAQRLNKLPGQ